MKLVVIVVVGARGRGGSGSGSGGELAKDGFNWQPRRAKNFGRSGWQSPDLDSKESI